MTATIEELNLEELTNGTPPCTIAMYYGDIPIGRCGQPSAYRIHTVCPGCANESTDFVCKRCMDIMRATAPQCTRCLADITHWTVI